MSLILHHYSAKPIQMKLKQIRTVAGRPDKAGRFLFKQSYPNHDFDKPKGLWVSDDSDYGWAEWCKDNNFRPEDLKIKTRIHIHDHARILLLDSADEILKFTRMFGVLPTLTQQMFNERPELESDPFFISQRGINWVAVAQQYQGILITPYLWSCRMHDTARWYYPWDCASGCIWDGRAIAKFERILSHEQSSNTDSEISENHLEGMCMDG